MTADGASAPAASPVPPPVPRILPAAGTILAPMQDVTTPAFMRLVAARGAPNLFVTEFIRVHSAFVLDRATRAELAAAAGERPLLAQIIGGAPAALAHAARELAALPVAGVDLNLGCPAPKVFKKSAGGGLLRDLARVDAILAALRDALPAVPLTVKTRTGFDPRTDPPDTFERLLDIVERRGADLLAVHARSVRGLYREPPDYSRVTLAVQRLRIPVIANGDITSADKAAAVLRETGCAGVMLGRPAVRNPWVFRQIEETLAGTGTNAVFTPTLADVRAYIDELAREVVTGGDSRRRAAGMKKFLNFVGAGVDPNGAFLNTMRRASDLDALFRVCDTWLLDNGRAALPFPPEPYAGVVSRPNYEL